MTGHASSSYESPIHDMGQLLDHRQAGDVALQLGHVGRRTGRRTSSAISRHVLLLHARCGCAGSPECSAGASSSRDHAVDDVAGNGHVNSAKSSAAFFVSMMIISSGTTTKKKAVFSLSVRICDEALMRCLMYCSSVRILSSSVSFSRFMTDGDLVVLAHLLAQVGDLVDPLVVDLGHLQVVERVAEGDQVVDVVVVVALARRCPRRRQRWRSPPSPARREAAWM